MRRAPSTSGVRSCCRSPTPTRCRAEAARPLTLRATAWYLPGVPSTTASDGARIHYEVHGAGDPVLLIMGLGSNAYGWERTIPWLSARYQAIAFDNRGTGRSDVPEGPYSVGQMATDAAAVLDA